MANSQRRYKDKNGYQFIPMNVEGQGYNDSFITTPKLVVIISVLLSIVVIIMYTTSENISISGTLIYIAIWFIASSLAIRYIVFEEKFYYRMYKELQGREITTPSIFWNIASIRDLDDGAIITYADAKIGIIIKVERDTIVGKERDFEEIHYDSISDFYRALVIRKYNFIQLNLMETAGNDPRLLKLDKLTTNCSNENIKKLVEMQVGHIKKIAQSSLYESDYFLIWTQDITRIDTIIEDINECMYNLLSGAYTEYRILSQKDIIELEKQLFGIKYFNSTDASLNIYKNDSNSSYIPFTITGIIWEDENYMQELSNSEISKLRDITSCKINNTLNYKNISVKEAIYVEKEKNNIGVDFSGLGKPLYNKNNTTNINKDSLENINLFDDEDDDDLIRL